MYKIYIFTSCISAKRLQKAGRAWRERSQTAAYNQQDQMKAIVWDNFCPHFSH